MRSLTTAANTALASNSVAIVQLIYMAFSTTPIAINTSTWALTWDGITYSPAAGLGSISAIEDKPGEVTGINFDLFGDTAHIALALDEANIVQGTECTIRTAIIETTNYTVVDAPTEWTGRLDTMSVVEDGNSATISVTAESRAVDLMNGNAFYYSQQDQLTIDTNDLSFSYVVDQVDKPIVWPTKAFFYK